MQTFASIAALAFLFLLSAGSAAANKFLTTSPLQIDESVFVCNTSKLHYLPGEPIEFRAMTNADLHPMRNPAKLLRVELINADTTVLASVERQYALPEQFGLKQMFGTLPMEGDLAPGRYRLVAKSLDLHPEGKAYGYVHDFGVLGPDDPFVCESPNRFVKDFAFLRDETGLFHIFAITGEYAGNHAWTEPGQERTFSHMTSRDLRNWLQRSPVLGIHDKTYPDGNGKYQNRNVWAPYILHVDGTYYMFYTSVNEFVSQSISLATSPDLVHWTEYENNPIFTLEGVEWADWGRDRWANLRDPMVIKHEGVYYMYNTATTAQQVNGVTGAIVVAESTDLLTWTNPQVIYNAPQPESVFVWKEGDSFYLTASGGIRLSSANPVSGWVDGGFPDKPLPDIEPHVSTSAGYADEIVQLSDGRRILACMTWRLWGNSIYIFEMLGDANGKPTGYKSPFSLGSSGVAEQVWQGFNGE